MNFLSHYAFNHHVARLDRDAWFVMGVAIPDLWTRFSRKQRIRWKQVRAAQPPSQPTQRLRAGLLNHAEADRVFHVAPRFLRWQRAVKQAVATDIHPAVFDFLTHVAVELAMDHHLVCDDPALPQRFYDDMCGCDFARVERSTAALTAADTAGFAALIQRFVDRQFLAFYHELDALADILGRVLALTVVKQPAPPTLLTAIMHRASEIVRPDEIWNELRLAPDHAAAAATSRAAAS